jgi:membrane associated rhomboid family serine protease
MKTATISALAGKIVHRLTKAVKLIVIANIVISILLYLISSITKIELQDFLGTYPSYSVHFHYYQLFTFMFVHSSNPIHIISNILFLIIFAPSYEKKFGFKKVVFTYFICAWIGYLLLNIAYYHNKEVIEESILNVGINPKEIKIDNNQKVNEFYLEKLTTLQSNAVRNYNHVTSKTYGASGALFGFIVLYLFMNFKNIRKIPFLVLGLILIYNNVDDSIHYQEYQNELRAASFAHYGGMLGGAIILVIDWYFKVKNNKIYNTPHFSDN